MKTEDLFKKMCQHWHFDVTPKTQVDYCHAVIDCDRDDKTKVKRLFKYFKQSISKLTLENCLKDLKEWTKSSGNAIGNLAGTQATPISPK